MSIITTGKKDNGLPFAEPTILTPANFKKGEYPRSAYVMTDEEMDMRQMIIRHFTLGYVTMYTPRVEFNDLSTIQRMQIDQMSFNTYQPNNGQSSAFDDIGGWRSKAIRPVVRNKCISIAAHATARLIFPKIFAYNENSDEERDAAQVMEDLMEWAGDKSNYGTYSLYRTLTALTDPASIGYTEYTETYRNVKRPTDRTGVYVQETILDEELSGFQDKVVPVDELYIENFYEQDIQKQGWLIWRRVMSYSLAEAKYKDKYPNFKKYVKPGVQLIYNDANQGFYSVYDTNMRPYDVEEIVYWNRSLDVKIIMVNGVMLTTHDNPNPRNDKQYPFDKFGYEIINNRCFYYKSLAFKITPDANIINTLYPMIIDGTYLNLMPPMVAIGDEIIGSDVIVPGTVTTFSDPKSDLRPISTSNNLKAGMDTLFKVDESIDTSSESPLQQGQQQAGSQTAYEISRQEQNAATVLGLFIKMISQHVKDYGKLRLGDILQYLTIADADKITANAPLVYKTFLLHNKAQNGKTKTRKIKFDDEMSSEPLSHEVRLAMSQKTLTKEDQTDTELYEVNPELFRNLTYTCAVTPDVLNPRSEDLERAYSLEFFDRAIAQPALFDQEEIARILLSTNPLTKKDPDKYLMSEQNDPMSQIGQAMNPFQGAQQGGQSPLGAAMGKTPLPQTQSVGQVA